MISSAEIEKAWESDFESCAFDRVLKFYPTSSVFASSSDEECIVFMRARRESCLSFAHFWREACLLAVDHHLTPEDLKIFVCDNLCSKLTSRNFIAALERSGSCNFDDRIAAGTKVLPLLELPDPEAFEACYQMKADWNLQIFIAQCKENYYYYSWETTA